MKRLAAWIREEARLAVLPSWAGEDMSVPAREWPITQAIRRAVLRWSVRRDTARLYRLKKLRVEELLMVNAAYRREIANVETAISEASASLAKLSSDALTRRAMARAAR